MKAPQTSRTLLHRLRETGDEQAWSRFVEIYTPLLHRHAMSRGLQAPDASDVVQETMRRLFLALPRYDYRPERARFRTWLFRVAENQVNQFLRTRRRRPQGDGRTTMMNAADSVLARENEREVERRWEEDYRRRLFDWAAEGVKDEFTPRIWEAFWRTAVGGESIEAVGAGLGMSRAAVYMARSRCLCRIREKVDLAGTEDFDPAECPPAAMADDE